MPFADDCAESVLSIAVIHHFSTYERRLTALSELFRILKKGGLILIYVWAYEQNKFKDSEKDTMLEWNNQTNGKVLKRYYYLFSKGELDNLININFNNIRIIESGIQCSNYYLICKKV